MEFIREIRAEFHSWLFRCAAPDKGGGKRDLVYAGGGKGANIGETPRGGQLEGTRGGEAKGVDNIYPGYPLTF